MRRAKLVIELALLVLCVSLVTLPMAFADLGIDNNGCRHTIKVVPVGGVETGDPIVTHNNADLMILHTGNGPIKNVWLLIVLNKPTYDALDRITINGSDFMMKSDFSLVSAKKIPPVMPNFAINYPGSLCQYEVAAIKDKMDETGNPVYYGAMFFLNQITKMPTYFTFTLELTSSVSDLKALILALGRYDMFGSSNLDCRRLQPFNVASAFSKSTLVVPEVATVFIAAAPLGALGLVYVCKRKKS
jgi:hypothetical protein